MAGVKVARITMGAREGSTMRSLVLPAFIAGTSLMIFHADAVANGGGLSPAVDVVKLVNGFDANDPMSPVSVDVGDMITYTLTVRNTGDAPLSLFGYSDTLFPGLVLDPVFSILNPSDSATMSYSAFATAGLVGNIFSVAYDWTDPTGKLGLYRVTDSDPAYYFGVSVPEPDTLALLGLGLAGLSLSRRRRAN